jgi:hypothetical protein
MKRRRPEREHLFNPAALQPCAVRTATEVARLLGTSKQHVNQVEIRALNKLRRLAAPLYLELTGHAPNWKT